MRVLGQDEVEDFLRTCNCTTQQGEIRSFICEIKHFEWNGIRCILRNFPSARLEELPMVSFFLVDGRIQIDCIVQFETDVIFIVSCKDRPTPAQKPGNPSDREAA